MKLTAVFMLIVLAFGAVAIAGCGDGRDLSTGYKALIGHWTYEGGESGEIYFAASGRYTEVGRDPAYSGYWNALESARGAVVIGMRPERTDWVIPELTVVITFGPGSRTADMNFSGESRFAILRYVDSKQKP